jgi:acetyl esterase
VAVTELVTDVDGRRVRPGVARLLTKMRERAVPPFDELGVELARRMVEESASLQTPPAAVAEVFDLVLQTDSGTVGARVYRPVLAVDPSLLVYVHGGGWATGSIQIGDSPCRDLAAATGHVVVSIDYRRSPEAPFPGPLDDVVGAVRALAERRDDLSTRPDRLILFGDSAGGNLAAAATQALRSVVTDQVLLYPALDPTCSTDSHRSNADDPVLSGASMRWFWKQYLGNDADPADPRVSPLLATDLSGLPRTLVLTCGLDVLHDEGVAYATALEAAGCDVTAVDLPGLTHGFWWMSRLFAETVEVDRHIARWLGESTQTR